MIIGHYEHDIWAKGGVATYIRHIGESQRAAGHTVYYFSKVPCQEAINSSQAPIITSNEADLFLHARQLKLDILHLHTYIHAAPPEDIKLIRTLHGHHPYCPSGSRYLARWNKPCDRAYSPQGCLWGHLIDHCGSVRLNNMHANFQNLKFEQTVLSKIPTIAVSQFLKDQMIRSGYPENLITVLRLFLSNVPDYIPLPQDDPPRFVFIGRITPLKGLEWLLRAMHEVNVPVHLDIAGEGYSQLEMQKLAQKLSLSNRITFYGWVSPDKALHLIQSARALIFPSVWHEPAGYVALETAAARRALIGSKVGGIPEYAESLQNALLVEPGNVEQLATAITQLASNWTLAKELGENGHRNVKHYFNCKEHLRVLTQIYQTAIRSKP